MEDLEIAARLLRWTVANFIHNLSFIPADKLDWKAADGVKSPLEIAGEVVAGQRMMLPVFTGGEWAHGEFPRPGTFEEAKALLEESVEAYATALESAEPADLDRMVPVFQMPVWGPRAVLLPVIDAVHHHGQITFIQSLQGDMEYHFDMTAAGRFFARPETG